MDIYYELLRKKLIDANGRAAACPTIHLGEKTTWNLHLRTGSTAADLSGIVSWRAAIDKDWSAETDPMCRTVSNIDTTQAADGILGIPLNANTATFAAAVNGKRYADATFELRGYDATGDVVLVIQINVQALGAIDPAGVSDLDPVPDGMASEAWVRAYIANRLIDAPAGIVSAFAGDTAQIPSGYLLCNGAAISRTDYAALFAAIGTIYGTGDGSTTFNLPDFRGKFLRGYLDGTSAALDTAQGDAIRNITGGSANLMSNSTSPYSGNGSGPFRNSSDGRLALVGADDSWVYTCILSFDASRQVPTASENRPANYAVNYIIKY